MYEDEDDLIERVSDDEGNDDDAMDEGDGGQQERSRSGRDVPADDGEPQLEGYARYVRATKMYLFTAAGIRLASHAKRGWLFFCCRVFFHLFFPWLNGEMESLLFLSVVVN